MNFNLSTLILDKYRIIKKLGGGSYGDVYKVQDINDDKLYAAKVEKCTGNTLFGLYNE